MVHVRCWIVCAVFDLRIACQCLGVRLYPPAHRLSAVETLVEHAVACDLKRNEPFESPEVYPRPRLVSPKRYAAEDDEGKPTKLVASQFQERVNRLFPNALTEQGHCVHCGDDGASLRWNRYGPVNCESCGYEFSKFLAGAEMNAVVTLPTLRPRCPMNRKALAHPMSVKAVGRALSARLTGSTPVATEPVRLTRRLAVLASPPPKSFRGGVSRIRGFPTLSSLA